MSILVVEDEFKIIHFIKNGLEMEGYSVELAYDGYNGLAKAEANSYDLIILDLMLPGIDGLEVCKALRRKNIKTPVIMLTARDTDDDRALGLAAGADDYLVKPFIFRELTDSIRSLLHIEKTVSAENAMAEHDRRQTDAERDRLDELNRNIMDNAPVSIITIDKEGYMTSANKFYQNFSKTGEYVNHNIFTSDFFKRENLVEDYKKLLTDGTIFRKENCYEKNSKGEDKYIKIIAAPIRDKHGNIEGALSMAVDNTEAVLFKNKLEELNKDLELKVRQRTAELDTANRELAKVSELKTMFMADVSHEMRTSLTIIQGNLELMARAKAIGRDSAESNEQIYNEIQRISAMLSDLTSLSSHDSTSQKLIYDKVDVDSLISSVCTSLGVVAMEKNIKINHNKNMAPIEIIADRSKLEKLISNLVRNAVRYNKTDGWINVWAEDAGVEIAIKVEDGGIGIPEEHLPNIFERFYRVDKSRSRNDGGSGLGLAICKWIAELHGGTIDVTSHPGQGSRFTVRLPRLRQTE